MSLHDLLERTKLPLIIVVIVPILGVLYVFFGANLNSSSPSPEPSTQAGAQPLLQTTTPIPLPEAAISVNDAASLPQQVNAAQIVPFAFTIQNPSAQSATYQYKVAVRWSTGESDVIDVNTLTLAPGASQTIPEALKFEIATETAAISFQLPQTGQSLQLTIPRTR